jgi:hypothetical protein
MARKAFDLYLVFTYVFAAGAIVVWAATGSAQRDVRAVDAAGQASRATTGGSPTQDQPQDPSLESKGADQRVTGKVLDRDGKAVDKAEVRVAGTKKKDTVWTDAQGEFSFSGPAGDYVITVKAGTREKSFNTKIEDNQLKPDSTLVIDPELAG